MKRKYFGNRRIMRAVETIVGNYPVTQLEYDLLNEKFGDLCYYALWQLKKKNSNNAQTNDPDDDIQELRIAMIQAGSYYKRQTYIEECLEILPRFVKDKFVKKIVRQLQKLWDNRRRHGANKQVFGGFQEAILDHLIKKFIPKEFRPKRNEPLKIDAKFKTYAKQIIWNKQKYLGKKITKDKPLRTGLVSLSEFDYLCPDNNHNCICG